MRSLIKTAPYSSLTTPQCWTIETWMHEGLYHPADGYYANKTVIGKHGDFITAPEISPTFSEMLALWIYEQWHAAQCPRIWTLVELGPGLGTNLHNIIQALICFQSDICHNLHIICIEHSEIFRNIQRQRIAHPHVTWYKDVISLSSSNVQGPVFVIGNEFFDALPFNQWVYTPHHAWHMRCVQRNTQHQLEWVTRPPDYFSSIQCPFDILHALPSPRVDDVYEQMTTALHVAHHLNGILKEKTGAILILDYGYISWPRISSLRAIAHHAYVDPLKFWKTADLSVHVDFSQLIKAFYYAKTFGPVSQGVFLHQFGIHTRFQQLMKCTKNNMQKSRLHAAAMRLTHPLHMGNNYHVIMASYGLHYAPMYTPLGFQSLTQYQHA